MQFPNFFLSDDAVRQDYQLGVLWFSFIIHRKQQSEEIYMGFGTSFHSQ